MKQKSKTDSIEQGSSYEFKRSRVSNLFTKSGKYWGRCQAFGKRHKKCFGNVTLEEAQEELRKWIAELQGWNFEPSKISTKGTTVDELLTEVEAKEKQKNISEDHRLYIQNRIKFIRTEWPEVLPKQPGEIEAAQIIGWIDKLRKSGYAASTMKGSLIYLNKVFELAEDGNILFENPMDGISMPVPQPKPASKLQVSPKEFDLIIDDMRWYGGKSSHAADLVELLAATGTRISEIRGTEKLPGLRWNHVDEKRRVVTIYGAKGRISKGTVATPRIVPFHPRLEKILKKLKKIPHKPQDLVCKVKVAKRSLKGAPLRLFKEGKIQVDRLTHQDLRHLFATWCIEAGIDIPTVADLLGHRDGGVLLLRTYRHLRTEHLHNQAKKLEKL